MWSVTDIVSPAQAVTLSAQPADSEAVHTGSIYWGLALLIFGGALTIGWIGGLVLGVLYLLSLI